MPTLETATRSALADALDALINTGSGTANLKLESSADAEIATFDFANPAFGAASSGVITLEGVPITDASATGGTVAQASIYNRNGDKVLEATAAASGAEVTVSSVEIAAEEEVNLTALTITVPAS